MIDHSLAEGALMAVMDKRVVKRIALAVDLIRFGVGITGVGKIWV